MLSHRFCLIIFPVFWACSIFDTLDIGIILDSGSLASLNLANSYLNAEGAKIIVEVLPKW
jgi:hypothetical protein